MLYILRMRSTIYILLLIKLLSTLEIELVFFVTLCHINNINDHTEHTKDVTLKKNLISCNS